ncbi:hypothetical protein DFH08DRAFT_817778 [Mycena albidolilacea]|uniref:Uncharacterized protein n=1 Tax=Mycena albidolilacea TaxID=1033008 RepID=A0AAD6ZIH0_9AGAR|nr:hypothetical protein DFH08DRAFT_817778 [Mycena albidolilacea]
MALNVMDIDLVDVLGCHACCNSAVEICSWILIPGTGVPCSVMLPIYLIPRHSHFHSFSGNIVSLLQISNVNACELRPIVVGGGLVGLNAAQTPLERGNRGLSLCIRNQDICLRYKYSRARGFQLRPTKRRKLSHVKDNASLWCMFYPQDQMTLTDSANELLFLTHNSHSIDARKVFTKEQFDAKVAAIFQNTAGHVETPAEDVQILANLLGVSPETLGGTAAGFAKGGEACSHCGRALSFLDIAETGLQAHSKEFLVDVITGKHGYIVNSGHQPFNCHECGSKPPQKPVAYATGKYVYLSQRSRLGVGDLSRVESSHSTRLEVTQVDFESILRIRSKNSSTWRLKSTQFDFGRVDFQIKSTSQVATRLAESRQHYIYLPRAVLSDLTQKTAKNWFQGSQCIRFLTSSLPVKPQTQMRSGNVADLLTCRFSLAEVQTC